jgi:hypothetical protein
VKKLTYNAFIVCDKKIKAPKNVFQEKMKHSNFLKINLINIFRRQNVAIQFPALAAVEKLLRLHVRVQQQQALLPHVRARGAPPLEREGQPALRRRPPGQHGQLGHQPTLVDLPVDLRPGQAVCQVAAGVRFKVCLHEHDFQCWMRQPHPTKYRKNPIFCAVSDATGCGCRIRH